jgi:transcriptional regulator with XRE-family HTH domain
MDQRQNGVMPRRVTPDYRQKVGERVRLTREWAGLSIAELCRRIGERANTWSQYENGARLPDPVVIEAWEAVTPEATLEWIYWGRTKRLPHDFVLQLESSSTGPRRARRDKQNAAK